MGDPRHPTKVVIVVEKGCINAIYQDGKNDIRFFIADYDIDSGENPELGVDASGDERYLFEYPAWIDTGMVRKIINKKGGAK